MLSKCRPRYCIYSNQGEGKWRRPRMRRLSPARQLQTWVRRGAWQPVPRWGRFWGQSERRSVPSSAGLQGRRQATRRRQNPNRSENLLPSPGRSRRPPNRRPRRSLQRRDLRARSRPRSGSNNLWYFKPLPADCPLALAVAIIGASPQESVAPLVRAQELGRRNYSRCGPVTAPPPSSQLSSGFHPNRIEHDVAAQLQQVRPLPTRIALYRPCNKCLPACGGVEALSVYHLS